MFEAFNTPEINRLALVIGAFVAVSYKNIIGVNPGGVIVPGFIIISCLVSPVWCISIIALSFFIYFVYKRWLDRTDYKRRTPMYIMATISLAIANFIAMIYVQCGWLTHSLDNLPGTLLPAVIAYTFTKQKMHQVVKGIWISTLITIFSLIIVYLLGFYLLNINFDNLRPLYIGKETLEFKFPILQFYIALAIGYIFYRYRDVRSGGYMVAPVAAVMLVDALSAVLFLLGCLTVYLVTQIICSYTLTIGLKRYTLALFLSTVFVWSVELIFIQVDANILPFKGSNLFVIIAMMSYVNDGILYAKKNVIIYMSLTLAVSILAYTLLNFVSTNVLL